MNRNMKHLFLIIIVVILISGACSTTAKHPMLKKSALPRLIPLREFFLNQEAAWNYKISPDGKRIAWLAVKNRRATIFFRNIDKEEVKIIETYSKRRIYGIAWLQDSRRMIFHQDQEGNENHHIFIADTENPDGKPRDITPFSNTKAWTVLIPRKDPEHIIISHNHRLKEVFDLYRVNINSGRADLFAGNNGHIASWILDDENAEIKGRVIKKDLGKGEVVFTMETLQFDNRWKKLISWGMEDEVGFLSFTKDKQGMWLLSNKNREYTALTKIDIKTGKETVYYEHEKIDIEFVKIDRIQKEPTIVGAFQNYPEYHFFDKSLESDIRQVINTAHAGLFNMNSDYSEQKLVFTIYTDKISKIYLLNRKTHKITLLQELYFNKHSDSYSPMTPISLQSRDGLILNGYITIPKGSTGKGLPMVLFVHGGPWARDYWGYNPTVQFLANRGYAVLQINYRGSIGYGRSFKLAAVGEFAGKMHTDLIDSVNWAIENGIADPAKIGIFGRSYGGYATLVGLTFTPDKFACGVDMVGISNLVSFMEAVPEYWKPWMFYWYKYVGDPENSKDLEQMKAKSPLFKVDNIKRPLLIAQGGNDPRVKQKESDQIVSAIKKSGKEVEYLLAPDEGHGFRFWKNVLRFNRKMEDFLAKHLGGRSAGFDYYELGLIIY